MVRILREADATPMVEVARKHGISDQTIYLWRERFGKLEAADVKRLRHLEQENTKLKKLVAEHDLEIDVMKEVACQKPAAAGFGRCVSGFSSGAGKGGFGVWTRRSAAGWWSGGACWWPGLPVTRTILVGTRFEIPIRRLDGFVVD